MAHSAPLLIFLIASVFTFGFYAVPVRALNIGLHANAGLSLFKQCSKTCESMFCEAPPFLRYGKYCGLLYTGCPGEQPCDRLDTCCMHHDQCISKMGNDYLSQQCNKEFLKCVDSVKKSRAPSFKGNTCEVDEVIKAINNAMKAAIVAGKVFGKP
ncbi:Phospholipase A2 family protein [Perilla frutescens var. hirtella]|uniref:phospholipase A2 n=1 Tax=Perilla frutescens var. hirtella TaxID=608512 RepID=A0AAD4P0B3_PERFH|nr:Phospholipase A2 family protein [Perilla frutescens var. hirtella]